MRKIIGSLFCSFIFFSCAIDTHAETGATLESDCRKALLFAENVGNQGIDTSNWLGAASCLGYFMGLLDMNYFVTQTGKPALCPGAREGLTGLQAARIYLKYIDLNPRERPLPASTAAIHALQAAFPCQ